MMIELKPNETKIETFPVTAILGIEPGVLQVTLSNDSKCQLEIEVSPLIKL